MKMQIILAITLLSYILSYNQPIIGVLTYPDPTSTEQEQKSKIEATYVRWLEAAGARVVTIHPWWTKDDINETLTKVNGVLFQGGEMTLKLDGPYEQTAKYILEKIVSLNEDKGIKIPLFAIGQGFQLLHAIVMQDTDFLPIDAKNYQGTLVIDQKLAQHKILSFLTDADIQLVQSKVSVYQNEALGVTDETYGKHAPLAEFFDKVGIAVDKSKKDVFIAIVEAIESPVYGVAFHPESVIYDRILTNDIPQNDISVRLSQSLANFFTAEARLNENRMSDEDLLEYGYINVFEHKPVDDGQGRYFYTYSNKQ
jgi:gamma-glutamyl hydrolase